MTSDTSRFREFFEVAALVGHDPKQLFSGEEITSYLELPSLENAKRIFFRATEEQQAARSAFFFTEALKARQRLGQGVHDRGEAVGLAGGKLSETDLEGLQKHLPLRMKVVSVLQKSLAPGEEWDLSVRGSFWGLGDLEELYVLLNVGHLQLAPGARVVIRGNVFSFHCQELTHHAAPGYANNYQVGILPTPFSLDKLHDRPHNGINGAKGASGRQGDDGRPLKISSSIVGPVLMDDPAFVRMNGENGKPGQPGQDGGRGRNGGMCKVAEITIRRLEGSLTVFSQAGAGGHGGHGGHGGDGGDGGTGSKGWRTINGTFPGGNGGNGADGGDGGNGGHGGNGGLASNIFINLPPEQEGQVTRIALPSEPGIGGSAGMPGLGGAGGVPGEGFSTDSHGQAGLPGKPGISGRKGNSGRSRHAASIFLNEKT